MIRPPPSSTLFPPPPPSRSRDQAARYYRRALEHEPGNPDYLYGLLDLYWSPQNGMSWVEATRSVNVGNRKSTRLNSSHQIISYAVFCLKKKKSTSRILIVTC